MKKAIVVGINYDTTPYTLNGCVRDMINIINLLIGIGYDTSDIQFLTDAPNNIEEFLKFAYNHKHLVFS